MLKIIHLAPFYFPHIGGVEHHVEQLNITLLNLKPQSLISVITLQHEPTLPLIETHKKITVYRLPLTDSRSKLMYKLSIWLQIWKLRQLLFEADIIHIHDIFWWLIPLLPFIPRNKLRMTFHGYEGNTLPKWNHIFWKRIAEKFTSGSIAIGEFQKQWYGIKPDYISYGAVESKKQKAESIRKVKTQNSKLKGIFIGRLEADNGIMKYLEAVKELRRQGAKVDVDVYGDGSLRQMAEAYVRKNMLPVNFYGFTENIAEKLSHYDVAFVSRYLSIIEGLSAGVPVMAQYNNELQRDYLRQAPFASWITIAKNSQEIGEALQQNKSLPSEARTWAQKQTWDKVAEVYLKLWKN